jgi:hypothetical protein
MRPRITNAATNFALFCYVLLVAVVRGTDRDPIKNLRQARGRKGLLEKQRDGNGNQSLFPTVIARHCLLPQVRSFVPFGTKTLHKRYIVSKPTIANHTQKQWVISTRSKGQKYLLVQRRPCTAGRPITTIHCIVIERVSFQT